MPFMPFAIFGLWFRGLLALGLVGGGIWLLATWYDALPRPTPVLQTATDGTRNPAPPPSVRERVTRWRPSFTWETAALGGGLLLVLVASGGGLLVSPLRWRSGPPVPLPARARSVEDLPGPDGIRIGRVGQHHPPHPTAQRLGEEATHGQEDHAPNAVPTRTTGRGPRNVRMVSSARAIMSRLYTDCAGRVERPKPGKSHTTRRNRAPTS